MRAFGLGEFKYIRRRRDAMFLRPGDFLCVGVATAVAPAGFRIGTPARIVLAGKGLGAIFFGQAVNGQARKTNRE